MKTCVSVSHRGFRYFRYRWCAVLLCLHGQRRVVGATPSCASVQCSRPPPCQAHPGQKSQFKNVGKKSFSGGICFILCATLKFELAMAKPNVVCLGDESVFYSGWKRENKRISFDLWVSRQINYCELLWNLPEPETYWWQKWIHTDRRKICKVKLLILVASLLDRFDCTLKGSFVRKHTAFMGLKNIRHLSKK